MYKFIHFSMIGHLPQGKANKDSNGTHQAHKSQVGENKG